MMSVFSHSPSSHPINKKLMNNYTVINVRNKSTYTIINVRNITIIRVTYLQAATVCRLSREPLPEELLEEHLAE